jgi:hypothetical protein
MGKQRNFDAAESFLHFPTYRHLCKHDEEVILNNRARDQVFMAQTFAFLRTTNAGNRPVVNLAIYAN